VQSRQPEAQARNVIFLACASGSLQNVCCGLRLKDKVRLDLTELGTIIAPRSCGAGITERRIAMLPIYLFAQDDMPVDFLRVFFGAAVVIWILAIVASIFWIWMIIDALTNEPTTNDKILWFLVIFFLHFIGALVYFVVRRSAGKRAAL
jgi:hypothetical protein